jgi:hypothetical protein
MTSIVEALDVVEYVGTSSVARDAVSSTVSLRLQVREKALHRSAIPAIAAPNHAALDAPLQRPASAADLPQRSGGKYVGWMHVWSINTPLASNDAP